MLDIAPTDTDKCIAWREQRASDLLFGEVLRKCGADDKKQFINTFFGGGTFMPPTANVTVTSTVTAGKVLKTIHAPVKRAVQTPISSYIMDKFIVSTINKKEKEKVKEKEKREEKEKESKKNIPCIKPI